MGLRWTEYIMENILKAQLGLGESDVGREVEARNKRVPGSSKGMNSGKDSAG